MDTLDKEVARLRSDGSQVVTGNSGSVSLEEPEPWPHPVDGAGLLDSLVKTISAHIVLPPGAAEAMALWVLHAHAHEASTISPILAITSPTPECGKTTTLTALNALVPRALSASNITSAALFRAVEKWRPTLLIDEADTFLKDSDELRGILNSGHARASAWVIRTTGDDHEPRRFATWSPKAIALIGKLPPTLDSRSIHVELRRIGAGEKVEALRGKPIDYLRVLGRQAARWCCDHLEILKSAEPEMPRALRGRVADNWRPLLAIADGAGEIWGRRAREAAEALTAGRSEQTAGVLLLEDLRTLFTDRVADRLASSDIIEALVSLDSRPWPEWKGDKPITSRQLARLLEPFSVAPTTIWADGRSVKGYHLDSFADAFARYLPPSPIQSVRPLGGAELRHSGQGSSVRTGPGPNG